MFTVEQEMSQIFLFFISLVFNKIIIFNVSFLLIFPKVMKDINIYIKIIKKLIKHKL